MQIVKSPLKCSFICFVFIFMIIFSINTTIGDSSNMLWLYDLGMAQWKAGEVERAVYTLKNCIDQYPNFAEAYDALANIYMDQGEYDQAKQYSEMALDKNPEDPFFITTYGILLYHQGNYIESQQTLLKALELTEDLLEANHYLGKIEIALNQYEAAIEILQPLSEANPNNQEIQQDLDNAQTLLAQSNQEFEELQPDSNVSAETIEARLSSLNTVRASSAAYQEQITNVDYYFDYIQNHGLSIDALNKIGVIYLVRGYYNKAIQFFTQAHIMDKTNFYLHYNLGIAFTYLNQYELAKIHYILAIHYSNLKDYRAYNNLGVLLAIDHNLEDAADCFIKAINLKEDLSIAQENLELIQGENLVRRNIETHVSYHELVVEEDQEPYFVFNHFHYKSCLPVF